jgi:hypothetical protein
MARTVMLVVHKNGKGWVLEEVGGKEIGTFSTKGDAVKAGEDRGHSLEARGRTPSLSSISKTGPSRTSGLTVTTHGARPADAAMG